MRKVSWLVAGINLLLIIALMGCGYAKRDQVEVQLADQKAAAEQGIQLAQDAAATADKKADAALATAREEIGAAKAEAIATAEEKDAEGKRPEEGGRRRRPLTDLPTKRVHCSPFPRRRRR